MKSFTYLLTYLLKSSYHIISYTQHDRQKVHSQRSYNITDTRSIEASWVKKVEWTGSCNYATRYSPTSNQNALRYHCFAQSSFSEFDGANSLPADAFSGKNFRQEDNFPTGKNLGWTAVTPCHNDTDRYHTQQAYKIYI